jgi:hypothetical protein
MTHALVELSRRLLLLRKWRGAGAGAVGLGLGVGQERRRPSSTTRTQTRINEEMSDDSEEVVPKAVHDLKTGQVQGKKGAGTLYLVGGSTTPTCMPQLAHDFTAALKATGRPCPPTPAP